ncbi:hypothetical protein [Arthrobacter sp. SW1]|nr:hypothetical protein [Arthrobacter sp. SW1]
MITLTSGWKMTVSAAAPTFAARRPNYGTHNSMVPAFGGAFAA